MKKIITWILIAALCICFAGCRSQAPNEAPKIPVRFYYRCLNITYGTAESVVNYESRESAGHENDFLWLLNEYVRGPLSDSFVPTFPGGTAVKDIRLDGGTVVVILNSELGILAGMDLSIACVCLAKTVTALTGHENVKIIADKAELDGKASVTINSESYLLMDDIPAGTEN